MTWNTYEKAFAREFPKGTVIAKGQGGSVDVTVPCKHGHSLTENFKIHMPPDKVKRVFTNKGWAFWGSRTTCPEHTGKDNAMGLDNLNDFGKAAGRIGTSKTAVAAAVPSDNAREAKRMAILILEENFDVRKGHFKNAYTDAKIAREVSLSEDAVAALREELFGPIKEPAEIVELRQQTDAFEQKVADFEREIKASREACDKALRALHEDVSKLKGRLAVVVERNGW